MSEAVSKVSSLESRAERDSLREVQSLFSETSALGRKDMKR